MNFYEYPKWVQREILEIKKNERRIREVILERNWILESLNIISITDTLEWFIIKCK